MELFVSQKRLISGVILLLILIACPGVAGADSKGLWIMPRKDTGNTARADVPGRMKTAPVEIWASGYDAEPVFSTLPIRLGRRDCYLMQVRYGLQLRDSNGRLVWKMPNIGLAAVLQTFYAPALGNPWP